MDDKLKHLLRTQIEREVGRGPRDVGAAMNRGRRKKTITRLGTSSGVILLAAAIAWTVVAKPFADDPSTRIVGPGRTASPNTFNVATVVTADFTAPRSLDTKLISTDQLTVDSGAVILSFSGTSEARFPDCVVTAELRLYVLDDPEGEPTIAAYPSRVFDASQVERAGHLPDNNGTLISNVPRGEPPAEFPSSGWVSWDVTEIYKQWFSERHFIGFYESVAVPKDEIVFSLRDETGEGPGFAVSFASLEYAEAHMNDDPFAFGPTLQLSIDEDCDGGSANEPPSSATGAVLEEVDEQTRAEIFAFRALAHNGLIDPYGARSYNWTYEEDTNETEGTWRVGFAASDCEPKGNTFTCTGLSGDDPKLGNAITDTYLHVALNDGRWEVLSIEGNMLAGEQERVIGYSLPDEREPSHWDFAAVSVWGDHKDASMMPIWVGPYPTQAQGSVCEVFGLDADGDRVGELSVFYQEPPNRPFERGGWVRGGGSNLPSAAVDAEVECEQYTGEGWVVAGEPEMEGAPGDVRGVTIRLEWHGPEDFTAPASCDATLVDEDGEVVWEGTERLEPLWPPPSGKSYPYKSAVFLHTGGEMIDAQGVGDFSCRTL